MEKIKLVATYPCLVKWKGGEEFLDETCSLEFDNAERLFVFPATGRKEDCAFVLDMYCPSESARYFSIQGTKFVVLEKNSPITAKETLSLNGKTLNIEIGQHAIRFDDGNVIKEVDIIRPKTYSLFSCENFALVRISSAAEQQLVAFDTNEKSVQSIFATRIEVAGSEITCHTNEHEEKYVIADGKLVVTKPLSSLPRNSAVFGMEFLKRIQNGQYREACLFVDERLDATAEKLEAYFGKIQTVVPLSENQYLAIKKSGQFIVQIDLKDDKICNIEILD